MKTRKEALIEAWEKIQKYCKYNYEGKSTQDVQFEWQHEIYVWQEFGVTPKGEAYFVRGNHSTSRRSEKADWYYHPEHKTGYSGAILGTIEDIVTHWETIKKKLEENFKKEQNIYNFKI
jgi:hypothetical protein